MRPISVLVIAVAVLIALTVVFYVRRWRLKEQYSHPLAGARRGDGRDSRGAEPGRVVRRRAST